MPFLCEKVTGKIFLCNPNATCGCSTSFTLITRIIGGESASHHAWSWAVSLRSSGDHFCGGTVLSPSFIITAAHCFEMNTDVTNITIVAGSSTLNTSSNDTSQTRSIAKLYIHPDYDSSISTNDVAILRLSAPLNMSNENIKPICLPSGIVSQPQDNIGMVAVGWGSTSASTINLSSTLLQVTLQSVPTTDNGCRVVIADSTVQFCAGIQTGGKDTCQGDSGGPLMAYVDNVWQLYGITSYGYQCALPGIPAVYTRVTHYIDWIKSIISPTEVWGVPTIPVIIVNNVEHSHEAFVLHWYIVPFCFL
ncbi:unnamed protein product [Rotaria sp. Silwood1]|nr:unnamed protein product [Rotaria sp. Silwood1]CAF4870026.1 unnamed protein product [Rotaria sp. Silwood1]